MDSEPILDIEHKPQLAGWQRWYARYMILIGVGGNYVFYGQALRIFQRESSADVSLSAFVVGLIAVGSWLIYGCVLKDKVLIIANTVAVIGAALAVIATIVYR